MNSKIELLAPAGDIERAKTAFYYGADAIYLGAKLFSLRANAVNFEYDELKEIIDYAHEIKRKVYVVSNIICHNEHLKDLDHHLKIINQLNPNGVIAADPFIILKLKKEFPNLEIHVSTQQSITNSKAALFFKKQGATRIVTAREVSKDELALMIKNINNDLEVETFIHGAVCVSYSGRCMMSNYFCLRDANTGGCAQPCRWSWTLFSKDKIYSKNFSMSPKDMSQAENIKELIDVGVKSFKIEGRMKSVHYVATVVNVYRKIIDAIINKQKINFDYENELKKTENRLTSHAWYHGRPSCKQMLFHDEARRVNQVFAFIVSKKIDNTKYEIIAKNNFSVKDKFEVIGIKQHNLIFNIKKIWDSNNLEIDTVKTPMRKYTIEIDGDFSLEINAICRLIK